MLVSWDGDPRLNSGRFVIRLFRWCDFSYMPRTSQRRVVCGGRGAYRRDGQLGADKFFLARAFAPDSDCALYGVPLRITPSRTVLTHAGHDAGLSVFIEMILPAASPLVAEVVRVAHPRLRNSCSRNVGRLWRMVVL